LIDLKEVRKRHREWIHLIGRYISDFEHIETMTRQSDASITWREVINLVIPTVLLATIWLFALIVIFFFNQPITVDVVIVFSVVSLVLIVDIGGELYIRRRQRSQ